MKPRKADRIKSNLKIKYKLKGKKYFCNEADCEDISGLGVKLSVGNPVSINDEIQILVYLSDSSKSINALCRVVWCRQLIGNKFQAGLKFVKIEDKGRFVELLCERMLDFSLSKGPISP